MNKSRECEEIVTDQDAGKSYRFAGTFGCIRMLSLAGRDPSLIFADLADGLLPPEEIKNVIKFSIEQVDGVDIDDMERESIAIEFIERSGLQDASLLARMMMTHAMIGAVKKKSIRTQEQIESLIPSPSLSRWRIIMKLGSLWVGTLVMATAGSTALVCTIIKLW